jgi:hypothetical protein
MRHLTALLAAATIALRAMPAAAGVVIEQDQNSSRGTNQHQTIMVQGNKERLETPTHIVITDLDKGKMYILQPAAKTYIAMDFPPTGAMARMMSPKGQAALSFTRLDSTRTVADYKCQDYKGTGKVMSGDYMITECFSTRAPGAKEFSAFQKSMQDKFKGTPMAGMEGNLPDGVPLASDSTMKLGAMAIPGLPPDQAKKMQQMLANRPPITTHTVVTKISQSKIEDASFEIPPGYQERQMPGRAPAMGMMKLPPTGSGPAAGAASPAASPAAQ